MNQFRLDDDLTLAAQYHCDKHVVKMPTETVQMLADCLRKLDVEVPSGYIDWDFISKSTNPNHPVTRWARESYSNWHSTIAYGLAVAREYQFRYGDKKGVEHKALSKLRYIRSLDVSGYFTRFEPTPFPLCMPEECKIPGDVVASYRRYYVVDKLHILSYNNGRDWPEWFMPLLKEESGAA